MAKNIIITVLAVLGIVLFLSVISTQNTEPTSVREDIPAPSEPIEEEIDKGIEEIPTEMSRTEAKEIYQDTIAEVEDKLGNLPIDDSVPSGEFGFDAYTIKDEALMESYDALIDRQDNQLADVEVQYAECETMPMNSDAEFAAYDECYNEASARYDKLVKKHDEENDWLTARQNQLWNQGQ
jgi:hypothetical protein